MEIKYLTYQEYENKAKPPNSQIVYFKSEVDLCEVMMKHFSKSISENITALKTLEEGYNEDKQVIVINGNFYCYALH